MNKKINVRISTLQFMLDIGIKNKLADSIASEIAIDQLIEAIDNEDIKMLLSLRGVGNVYAKHIIEEGAKLLTKLRKRVTCHHWHYMAPAYTMYQMLDEAELDMLNKLYGFNEFDSAADVKLVLNEFLAYERNHRNIPYTAKGAPEYNSLPSSILADIIGIESRSTTDKLALYKHNTSSLIPPIKYDEKGANKGDRQAIRDLTEAIQEAFLVRVEHNGFVTESGAAYQLFTHSSSQLKKESGYFMLQEEARKHKELFWFGMTPAEISSRTDKLDKNGDMIGSVVMTKIFQWRSLLLSAAIPSSDVLVHAIDMRKVIVVPEMEKVMTAEVMSVSADYKVTEGMRNDIKNPLWDGQIIMNARMFGLICAQLRALGLKGLGVGVDVVDICNKRGYKPVIVDINGVAHNLETEEWHLIADASTLKMLKPYGGTQHYFDTLDRLGLTEAYICAVDGEEKEENTISRQMMSSLFDISAEELKNVTQNSVLHMHDMQNLEYATNFMSESDRTFDRKSHMGKIISVVPELMKLDEIQEQLRDRYQRMRDQAQSGKLRVNGKYFFAVLDPVAWIDVHIGGKDPSDPTIGALRKKEVACAEYKLEKKLCCLRSPHAAHEWYTAWNVHTPKHVANGCIVFNVHDLAFRIMQMDFDGDHILVIQDDHLVKAVDRMQKQYNILPIYYEACAPEVIKPIPRNRMDFANQSAQCVMTCQRYNKVGQYSNFICSAWSLMNEGMSYEDARAHLRTIAILAAGVNGAVDAQKKYAMNFLPRNITEDFEKRPYNQRHHAATIEMPSSSEVWDKITMPLGDGAVDRACVLVDDITPKALKLDTDSINFNWKTDYGILVDQRPEFNKQPRAAIIPPHIAELIATVGKVNGFYEQRTFDAIMNGEAVGLKAFFNMIKQQNENFIDAYIRMSGHADGVQDGTINKIRSDKTELIRKIFAEYMAATHMPHVENMSEDDRIRYAANVLIKDTFKYESNTWRIVHLIRWFGDIYADIAADNRINGFAAKPENEKMALLHEEADAFTLDGLYVPGEDDSMSGMLDSFIANPMDDVME